MRTRFAIGRSTVRGVVGLCVVLTAVALMVGSASAESLSPWLRVGSVSRPGNLVSHAPLAPDQNEVQEVTMSSEGVLVEMLVGETRVETFATEPWFALFGGAAPEPTAANVQAALEKAYGKGNVVVTGGPGGNGPLIVESVGADAAKPVAPIKVNAVIGTAARTELTQGRRPQVDGYITATAINVGDSAVDGSSSPARVVDRLPSGLHALFVERSTSHGLGVTYGPLSCSVVSPEVVECLFEGKLPPAQQIEIVIGVAVQPGAKSGEENEVSASGGGVPSVHVSHPITINASETPFGVEEYALTPEDVGGAPDTQAGSHPFQLTTTFNLNQVLEPGSTNPGDAASAGAAKDLTFKLPAGLIGNPNAIARCSLAQFYTFNVKEFEVEENECPSASVVGVATLTIEQGFGAGGMQTFTVPLYNIEPGPGEPARFGFTPVKVPVILDTFVRTGEDYGVTVRVGNIPQSAGFLSNSVTFWGVPGDPRHDNMRGQICISATGEGKNSFGPIPPSACKPLGEAHPQPLLSLPTSCSGGALQTSVQAASWAAPHEQVLAEPLPGEQLPILQGCGLLPFSSEVHVSPDSQAGSTPSGLKVDVHVPQDSALNGSGLAPAMLKNIVVTLPEGLQLNPSAADGLQACTQAQIGLDNDNEATCPDASKIANVTIKSPLLPPGQYLHGFVYLASPQNFAGLPENPFSRHVAMYLVADDPVSGTLVKLAGNVELGGEPGVTGLAPGQIRSTFAENPQLPFEDAEIEFFGGERAPLATPALCRLPGSEGYVTHAIFEPWSNTAAHREALPSSSEFNILSGPNGTPCANPLPFSPSLVSEVTDINAGGFTPLVTTVSRPSGNQNIQSVTLHYPPGVSGVLKGVPLCPEAQANAGTCGPESLIGETIVSVGVGGEPFTVTGGKVYLTEKYAGAPFGLSLVNPAKAGPFDLQEGRPVVVRAKIDIDPLTAALTVTTDSSGPHAIPTFVEGFALQIQHVNVVISRPGFTFNPTSCAKMQITGAIASAEGASAPVSVPFQVANCEKLAFKPSFKVWTAGKTSRQLGASLRVRVTYPRGSQGAQANIRSVKVALPKQLPSELKTLQHACPARTFATNPAGCSGESQVGRAIVHTPALPVALEGPAYFVSHGGEEFPHLILVLQGDGVTIELVGDTFIKNGVTTSTFRSTPDVPFESFELNLPQGKFSALAANANLCRSKLIMPTALTAQNGLAIHQNTKIAVTGCPRPKAKHVRKHRKH